MTSKAKATVVTEPVEVDFTCPECGSRNFVEYCDVSHEFEENGSYPEFDWTCSECHAGVHVEVCDWV